MLQKKLEQTAKHFEQSPVRESWSNNMNLGPLSESIKPAMKSIDKDINTLIEKCQTPLKLVIMGEVKAGKSTLINALVGKVLSPTNVAETTASIIEISYDKNANGTIFTTSSNENIVGTLDEIYQTLDQKRTDMDFFKNVDYVKLGFPLKSLKSLHIIDTPGLATVREANEKRTESFIQSADVILWVFNGHVLGQADIEGKLEEVAMMGKPIIALINRVDELNTPADKLVNYLEKKIDIYVEDIMAISAKSALEGKLEGNEDKLRISGLLELLEYLETNIERNSENVQTHSIIQSSKVLIEKDCLFHDNINEDIARVISDLDVRKNEISFFNENIKRALQADLKNWFELEFLEREKEEMMVKVKQLGIFSKTRESKELSEELKDILSEKALERQLQEKYEDIHKQFMTKWERASAELASKIEAEQQIHYKNNLASLQMKLKELDSRAPSGEEALLDGAGKGAIVAGTYGATAAVYTAILGPAAASVSLIGAIGAILPPVLLVGATVGAVWKAITHKNEKNKFAQEIKTTFSDVKSHIEKQYLTSVLEGIDTESNKMANAIYNQICQHVCKNEDIELLVRLKQNNENYIRVSKMHLLELEELKEKVEQPIA
ncbi:dynamin family protein [Bacillus alkalisoli]|uniref:dynamin family protein n=1 Tax=Bacillus alkalisoli TaxID=2011008 RepID=UPI000C237772|nr:dynamin family protein [Bacillus alkalisoli]